MNLKIKSTEGHVCAYSADDSGVMSAELPAPDGLDIRLTFSTLRCINPREAKRKKGTLRQIHAVLGNKLLKRKQDLSLIKLVSFGDKPTAAGCIRHDANVLEVFGVEGDYDAGEITVVEAVEKLRTAGIAALVYTTASHTPEAPRFRVLAPLSKPHEPVARRDLMAGLNGALGGILARESFTLSTSFYIGRVEGVEFEKVLVEGAPLDLVPGLAPVYPQGREPKSERGSVERVTDPHEEQIKWARDKLVERAENLAEMEEGGRNHALNDAAMWAGGVAAHGFLTEDEARDALSEAAKACGLKAGEFRSTFRSGWTAGYKKPISDILRVPSADDFDDLATDEEGAVLALNDLHAVITLGGRTAILTERAGHLPALGDEGSLHLRYRNRRMRLGKGRPVEVSRRWLEHPRRREYPNGFVFRPDGVAPDGAYNLWRGWPTKPDFLADCPRFLAHLREVICAGDTEAAEWVLDWLADLVQNPGLKSGAALVVRGSKGAGKDIFGRYLERMIGASYLNTSNDEDLFGQFNSLAANRLLIHLEEAFFSGDPRTDSRVKSFITSETITVNEKFAPQYTLPACHRLYITSNSFRPVNATGGERRYLILEASDARIGDRGYFDALAREMNGDGPGALLGELLMRKITRDVRRAPITRAGAEVIEAGLKGIEAWWRDVLRSGEHPGADPFAEDAPCWRKEGATVPRETLRAEFRAWQREQPKWIAGDDLGERHFGKLFARFGIKPREGRTRAERRGTRRYSYAIPSLAEAQAAFEAHLGTPLDW
jgi:hypothetical protein